MAQFVAGRVRVPVCIPNQAEEKSRRGRTPLAMWRNFGWCSGRGWYCLPEPLLLVPSARMWPCWMRGRVTTTLNARKSCHHPQSCSCLSLVDPCHLCLNKKLITSHVWKNKDTMKIETKNKRGGGAKASPLRSRSSLSHQVSENPISIHSWSPCAAGMSETTQ